MNENDLIEVIYILSVIVIATVVTQVAKYAFNVDISNIVLCLVMVASFFYCEIIDFILDLFYE